MKTGLFRLFLIFNFSFLIFNSSSAQFAFIPDTNFRNFLMNNGFASCMAGDSLDTTCTNVISATLINCSYQGITNLEGIQYFDNLDTLECLASMNGLTNLPSLPGHLISLRVSGGQLPMLPSLPDSLKNL